MDGSGYSHDNSRVDQAALAKRAKLEQIRRTGERLDYTAATGLASSNRSVAYRALKQSPYPAITIDGNNELSLDAAVDCATLYDNQSEENRASMVRHEPPGHYVFMATPTGSGAISPVDLLPGYASLDAALQQSSVIGSTSATMPVVGQTGRTIIEVGGVLNYVNTGIEQLKVGDELYALPLPIHLPGTVKIEPNKLHNMVRDLRPFILVSAKLLGALEANQLPARTRGLLQITGGWAPNSNLQQYRTDVVSSSQELSEQVIRGLGGVLPKYGSHRVGIVSKSGMPGETIEVIV